MSQPLVSVVVPFYGVEAYIAQCARSLLEQTYPALQLVFVNDGTRDRSREVLSDVLAQYPERSAVIIDQENAGLPQARRTGVLAAAGDYILHVDSDDYLELDAVERLVACATSTGADVVHFYVQKEFGGGRSRISRDARYDSPQAYARDIVCFRSHGYVCNKFMRASLYREELFWPRYNMHEDIVLSVQLLHRARTIALLDAPLYHYRRDNPSAASRVRKQVRRGQSARNFLDLYEYWKGRADSPVAAIQDELLLRPAWYALSMEPALFGERPYLREEVARVPVHRPSSVKVFRQLWMKIRLQFLK